MKQKDNNGIEIEPWEMEEPKQLSPDTPAEQVKKKKKISRHSFRGPIYEVDAIEVLINDQKFDLVDIGSRGIGINLPEADIFSINDTVAIKLLLHEKSFSLEGQIKHISSLKSNYHRCGIELINLDQDTEKKLQTFLQTKRVDLFAIKE